jgi:surfeit locus 1 family protein
LAGAATTMISPVRGKWLWATLAVILCTALLVRLGFWQLQRLQERRANNAFLLARVEQPPVQLAGQVVDPSQLDLRRATALGTYDFSQEVVLRNQALNGAPGVHLITPLRISGSNEAVLIDRGWIPFERSDPAQRAAFDQPTGVVEVAGLIHRSQTRLNFLSPADPSLGPDRARLDEWFRVDIPRIQQQVPYALTPVFVEEGEVSLNAASVLASVDRLPQSDVTLDLSEGPHLGYAIQWFSFAAILLVGYVFLYRRQAAGQAGS